MASHVLEVEDIVADIRQEPIASFAGVRTQLASNVQTAFGDQHENQYESRTSPQDGQRLEEFGSESFFDQWDNNPTHLIAGERTAMVQVIRMNKNL